MYINPLGPPPPNIAAEYRVTDLPDLATRRGGEIGQRSLREAGGVLVIDAANVIGSRPTGWWRDRPGAARRFTEQVRAAVAAGTLDPPVTIVLEGQARSGVEEGDDDRIAVVHAPGEGDDTIAEIAAAHPGSSVVTADRELGDRVRAVGATVVGPNWLLDRLDH
jgi:hypothetical protein